MKYGRTIRMSLFVMAAAIAIPGSVVIVSAQDSAAKPAASVKKGGRDPFKKYEPVVKTKSAKLEAPSIQMRIERYRAQKAAAAAAHVRPPKPTTALMLNEIQVTGIFRSPRGWAAMVEAMPIKLSYVVYPGETFFDGQLVAIEENRLTFRRDVVWADGRREKAIEIKPLRKPSPVADMTAQAAPANTPAAETAKTSAPPEKQ
jgi:hypothetical protein